MNKFFLSALLPLALCRSASADVNIRDGSFLQTWTDFRMQKAQSTYDLNRTYNSRSLRQGIFGFGWCSEIETTIRWQGGQTYILDCHGTRKENLHFKNNFWWRKMENGAFQKFNSQGRLVALQKKPRSPTIFLTYQDGRLLKLKFTTIELNFLYSKMSGDLQKVKLSNSQNETLSKTYQIQDRNLVSVESNPKEKMLYQYDEFHNLLQWSFQKEFLKIKYDSTKDQVQSLNFSQGCQENYLYERLSPTTLQSSLERICPRQKRLSRTFRFNSIKNANQALTLNQVFVSENNQPAQLIRTGDLNDSRKLP